MILGSQFPTSGQSLVDGKPVSRVSRDCGIVYQNYSLFPHLSVLDNIAWGVVHEQTSLPGRLAVLPLSALESGLDFFAKMMMVRSGRYQKVDPEHIKLTSNAERMALPSARMPVWSRALSTLPYFRVTRAARAEASELLSDVGLDPVRDGDKYPFELSGGMRQRVAIAQALIMKPKILLMDEPFGALDRKTRYEMQDFMFEQWQKHKLTVFFVTHDLPEAVKLGTRLICLSQHWTNDDGSREEGARLTVDKKVLGGTLKPSAFKDAAEYTALVEGVGAAGLDDKKLLPRSKFDLSHSDAVEKTLAAATTQ
jgi:ABC-type nitrate/sulfonate/bicarbonate transport system ATPase subunit